MRIYKPFGKFMTGLSMIALLSGCKDNLFKEHEKLKERLKENESEMYIKRVESEYKRHEIEKKLTRIFTHSNDSTRITFFDRHYFGDVDSVVVEYHDGRPAKYIGPYDRNLYKYRIIFNELEPEYVKFWKMAEANEGSR